MVAILKQFNSILKNAQPVRNDISMDLFVYLVVLMVDKQPYVLVFCLEKIVFFMEELL